MNKVDVFLRYWDRKKKASIKQVERAPCCPRFPFFQWPLLRILSISSSSPPLFSFPVFFFCFRSLFFPSSCGRFPLCLVLARIFLSLVTGACFATLLRALHLLPPPASSSSGSVYLIRESLSALLVSKHCPPEILGFPGSLIFQENFPALVNFLPLPTQRIKMRTCKLPSDLAGKLDLTHLLFRAI